MSVTNKKGDPQHHPTINSCFVRIPGTVNSKCGQVVKIIQMWDGQRPGINYLLHDFRRWLIVEKLEQLRLSKNSKKTRLETINLIKIWCIERLLQTLVDGNLI